MENKGIIVNGGTFKAKNVAVGDNAKIENTVTSKTSERIKSPENADLSAKIEGLIKKGRLKEAIETLCLHFKNLGNKEALKAMIMQAAALNQLEMDENYNTITHEQAKIDRAKVTKSVLQLMDSQM
jgi:Effector-associated domain 11